MMKRLAGIICLTVFTTIIACKQNNTTGEISKRDTTTNKQFVKPVNKFAGIQMASKKDTSCGMPLSAGLEDTVHLNGKIYGFCSPECKQDFVVKLQSQKKR